MLRAELSTAMQCRHGLARVEQGERIKRVFDPVELLQLGAAELHAHLIYFLHADTVFAGDGAAHLNAQFQYASAEFLGTA